MTETWLTELVPPERRILTPDRYIAANGSQMIEPIEALVYHYSASGTGSGTARWLSTKDATYVSAHFVIDRDGAIWQLAPLEDRCFHAGGSSSRLFGRGRVNSRTIGLEFVNWGPLMRTAAKGVLVPVAAPSRHVQQTDVRVYDNAPFGYTHWQPFPMIQAAAGARLVQELVTYFPILAERKRHVGHSDVDPTRKIDPGPAFPWHLVVDAGLGLL